jgi:hypothetical protein
LQIAAATRGEATALGAAALFEQLTRLDKLLPIDPRAGTVPDLTAPLCRRTPIPASSKGPGSKDVDTGVRRHDEE